MAKPGTGRKYQHHPVERKREIVEATLRPGASVALIAREHGVNANQVWAWRKLYSEGRLDVVASASMARTGPALLAVDVIEPAMKPEPVGTLEIVLGSGRLIVTGAVDPVMLKTAIAALRA